jgi:putative PIN family toxin of toxin-antitoxin system
MRAVLDPNVLISAVLSRGGSPAEVLRRWRSGAYEVIVSAALLDELSRALAYPRVRRRVTAEEARTLLALLRREARLLDDPADPPPLRSPDPGDDYLIALAAAAQAVIVSGDRHLLGLAGSAPVFSPTEFLALLDSAPSG